MTSRYTLLDKRGKPVVPPGKTEAVRVIRSDKPASHYQRLLADGFRVIPGTNFLAPEGVDWIDKRRRGASPSAEGQASARAFQQKERFPSPLPAPPARDMRARSESPVYHATTSTQIARDLTYMDANAARMDGRGPPAFGAPFSVQTSPETVIEIPEMMHFDVDSDENIMPHSQTLETSSLYDRFAVPVQYPSNPSSPGTTPPTFEEQQRHLGEAANSLLGDPISAALINLLPIHTTGMATSTYQEPARGRVRSASEEPRKRVIIVGTDREKLIKASRAIEAADIAAGLLPAITPATEKAVKRAKKLAQEDVRRAIEHKDPIQTPIPPGALKKIEQGWTAKKKKPRAKKPVKTKKEAKKQLAKEVAAVVEVLGELGQPAPTPARKKPVKKAPAHK
jgi:hypothetical protein